MESLPRSRWRSRPRRPHPRSDWRRCSDTSATFVYLGFVRCRHRCHCSRTLCDLTPARRRTYGRAHSRLVQGSSLPRLLQRSRYLKPRPRRPLLRSSTTPRRRRRQSRRPRRPRLPRSRRCARRSATRTSRSSTQTRQSSHSPPTTGQRRRSSWLLSLSLSPSVGIGMSPEREKEFVAGNSKVRSLSFCQPHSTTAIASHYSPPTGVYR